MRRSVADKGERVKMVRNQQANNREFRARKKDIR
jgi:hypothetical protein